MCRIHQSDSCVEGTNELRIYFVTFILHKPNQVKDAIRNTGNLKLLSLNTTEIRLDTYLLCVSYNSHQRGLIRPAKKKSSIQKKGVYRF